jgi:uncharacterized protein (TIGR02271 family)
MTQPQPRKPRTGGIDQDNFDELAPGDERLIELREEQLVANKEVRQLGEIIVRTELEEVPARLEVEALREEIEVEHEAVGQAVRERESHREQDGVLILPVYEEQLVVSKRLVLRERLHIRRISTSERQLFQDTVRRDRLVVEDPDHTGLVHEVYPEGEADSGDTNRETDGSDRTESGFLTRLVSKALE